MPTRVRSAGITPKLRPGMLNRRALNRALLARQLLLERSDSTVHDALTHLVGLQAQTPNAPYIALWSRLKDFAPKHLAELICDRRVVRIALMRGTIHSVTDRDCLELRPHFARVLERGMRGAFGKHLSGLNLKEVETAARKLLKKQPLTFEELGKLLSRQWPKCDPDALANAARALVALVQIPPRGIWGEGGLARHALAETWLGKPLCATPPLERVIYRYLAAFGPATVRDVQAWSGLTGLRPLLESMRKDLITFMDEEKNEVFDLPDAPRPSADSMAPPRFLPVFDNVLLSHADRRRIVSETHRKTLFGTAALLEGSVLIDGFVGARWKISQDAARAVLTIAPLVRLRNHDRTAISEEGTRLLTFASPAFRDQEIQFAKMDH